MTNKLRSVIDNKIKACEGIYGFFPKNDHTNDQELCVKVELVELLMKEGLEEFLDAIIEEMEEELLSLQYKLNTHRHDSKEYAFLYACKTNQEMNVNKLKQAREELSSLTQ